MDQEFAYIREAIRDIEKDKELIHGENQCLSKEVGKLQEKITMLEQALENAEIEMDKRESMLQRVYQENNDLEQKVAAMLRHEEDIMTENTKIKAQIGDLEKCLKQAYIENKSMCVKVEALEKDNTKLRKDSKDLIESRKCVESLQEELKFVNEDFDNLAEELKERTNELKKIQMEYQDFKQSVEKLKLQLQQCKTSVPTFVHPPKFRNIEE